MCEGGILGTVPKNHQTWDFGDCPEFTRTYKLQFAEEIKERFILITEKQLEEICTEYGIDYEKLIKANSNILEYGHYEEIRSTLEFLRREAKIEAKNIEKCPSILYLSTREIENNWEFLKEHEITISNVESCLHVLSTEHEQIKKTYNYVISNYGVRYLNAQTSILRVPVERIQEIEEKFKEEFKPKNFLQAAYSRHTI